MRTTSSVLTAFVLSLSSLAIAADSRPGEKAESVEMAQGPAAKEDLNFARSLSRAFRSVGSKVEPSVVHITQLNKVQQVRRDVFGFPISVGPERLQATGLGSGFLISRDGYIVTNNHVVAGAQEFRVKFADGKELAAKRVGQDAATDLAVIKVEGNDYQPIEFGDSDSLEQGDWVVALGSPLGLSNSMTAGIVSAKGRSGIGGLQSYQDFIQTDAAINPGNSGGPLVDLEGKLVGVNSAIASKSGGYEGVGFAIPEKIVQSVTTSIIKNGRVDRGWLGINFERTPQDPTRAAGHGVRVSDVADNGPADKAGIKAGDVIVEYNGKAIDTEDRLVSLIALTPPNTDVNVGITRDGKKKSVTAQVGDQNKMAQSIGGSFLPEIGLTVRDLSSDEVKRVNSLFRRNVIRSGVTVVQIESGSRAEAAEFQTGDVLFAVDERLIANSKQLESESSRWDFNHGVNFGIIRDRQRGTIAVQD